MTDYNVTIETTARPSPELADHVLEQLDDFAAVLARSPRGRAEIILTVPAAGLRQAVHLALALVDPVLDGHGHVVAVEAMTTREFDARADAIEPPAMPELVSVTEAAAILGVTRQAVLQRLAAGTLAGTQVGTAWVIPRAALSAG